MAKKQLGAPRKHDYEDIGKKLLEWSKLDNSINICDFCVNFLDPPIYVEYLWDMQRRDENLSYVYKIAQQRIGIRREKLLNSGHLHQHAYGKSIRHYDPVVVKESDAEKEFDHELKKKEIEQEALNLSDIKQIVEKKNCSKK